MYFATDLKKKKDVIAAIPNVRTVFPDKYQTVSGGGAL